VPEHLIRLRGGWESIDLDDSDPCPKRITLPVPRGSGQSRRLRLARRFGRPPLDARTESLWLRLDRVAGLRSLMLNGSDIPVRLSSEGSIELPLAELPDRNELVLEVTLPAAAPQEPGGPTAWGDVALLIRSKPA
jgi:hypothetical protein